MISMIIALMIALTIALIIAELAERSPIIIQNGSNPSSRKKLDVRPYDRTTVRPYKVLLLICVVNCTAGTPTPRIGLRVGRPGF